MICLLCPGERPFNCSMCEKSFRDRSELNRHSRRHTGDLPYKCGTCSKGFLRRERYITHCRIHTGEKPYVCGVCNRGYRDKRELKKHQATHNHGEPGGSPGSSGSGQQAVVVTTSLPSPPSPAPAPVRVQPKPVQVSVQPPPSQPAQAAAQQAPAASPSQVATITFSLPTEPVPKNQLGLPQPEQQFVQPLNPAQIALPPSVATALQNLNQKAVKPGAAPPAAATAVVMAAPTQTVKQEQMQILKQVQIVDSGEAGAGQQIFAGGALPPGLVAGAGSAHPQFFYCIVPGAAVQPYAVEGGAIRVSTGEGQTAQLVTIPSGAFQAAQIPVSSGQTFPQLGQYIIDSAGPASAGASGSARSAQI